MRPGRLWMEYGYYASERAERSSLTHERTKMLGDDEELFFMMEFQQARSHWVKGGGSIWQFAGLGLRYLNETLLFETGQYRRGESLLAIPFWMLTVLFALWPALFATRRILRRRRHNFRVKHNLCLHCGYDLRATPERCPECGRDVEPKPT